MVSFIDDIHDLRPASRLAIQVVTVAAAYWWLHFWPDVYLLTLILGVGFINAYNFMDGISGMLAAYSLVTLGAILYAFHSLGIADTADTSLTVSLLVATVIFGIFNFRRRSLVFCGDVGSIVMGYFILYLMVRLTLLGHDASCIVMLMVYGVDTVLTIFGRLFKGENILAPHRSHLYQRLANEKGYPHIAVAIAYAGVQALIDVVYFLLPAPLHWTYAILVTTALIPAYFLLKSR